MSFRSLLVHAQPGEASKLRTEAAAALAIKLDALLIGLGAEAIPPIAAIDPYGFGTAQWTPLLYEQQTRNLEAAHAAFAAHAKGARRRWVPHSACACAPEPADEVMAFCANSCRLLGLT